MTNEDGPLYTFRIPDGTYTFSVGNTENLTSVEGEIRDGNIIWVPPMDPARAAEIAELERIWNLS